MNALLTQAVLAASNTDEESTIWIQMLVLVILAALWGIGSLIKTRANKFKDTAQGYAEDANKPYAQTRWRNRAYRRSIAGVKALTQKFTTKTQDIRLAASESMEEPELTSLASPMEGDTGKSMEFPSEPLKELKDRRRGVLLETAQSKVIIKEPTLEFNEPETISQGKLKNASVNGRRRDVCSGMELLELDFVLSIVENIKGDNENDVTMRKLNFNELVRRKQQNEIGSNALRVYAINEGNLYGKDIQCEAMKELTKRSAQSNGHSN